MKSLLSKFDNLDPASKRRRRAVSGFFRSRRNFFNSKKKFDKTPYPVRVIDPFLVFGDVYPVGKFHLVGRNWLDRENQRPVALLWGFNAWKLGFVSKYLDEYRALFAPRKMLSWATLLSLRDFPIKPDVFIFWGKTEPKMIRLYAKARNIPVYRMEDGFLRSAQLGAAHSTPYSLVLDKGGIHYDPESDSELEKILNTYEFSDVELQEAQDCLTLLREMRLSKYNPPTVSSVQKPSIKLRRRVAVIGQVDNDQSVRCGNQDGWTMKEIIQLAKLENPEAEILYRPHPEVYRGYQNSRFRARSVENICQIVDPDVPLPDFLESVDHVYTLTSLSGLEALLRGITVTTLGAAFYGGWGLTDDRVIFKRRVRQRSLIELFAAIYLKYPSYLANLKSAVDGFKSACIAIAVDSELGRYETLRKSSDYSEDTLISMAASKHWPQLLFGELSAAQQEKAIKAIDFGSFFQRQADEKQESLFEACVAYALCGICQDDSNRESLLVALRPYLSAKDFGQLLFDLSQVFPGNYVARQFAWLLASLRNQDASLDVLRTELDNSILERAAELRKAMESSGGDEQKQSEDRLSGMTTEQAELKLGIFEYSVEIRDFEAAVEIARSLLLGGFYLGKLLPALAELAEIQFDFAAARRLASLAYYMQPSSPMAAILARTTDVSVALREPMGYLGILARVAMLRPGKLAFCLAMLSRFEDEWNVERMRSVLTGILMLDGKPSIGMAQALMAMERPNEAVQAMRDVISDGDDSPNARIAYAQALSFAGRLDDAINVMRPVAQHAKSSLVYREMLRLYILAGDYVNALAMVREAQSRSIDIGEMLPRKVYFGARMVRQALFTFTELQQKLSVKTYYKKKYHDVDVQQPAPASLALLAIFGPGDELRFSSMYNLLPAYFPGTRLSATCDPRVQPLFERSFPHIDFYGVRRLRDSDRLELSNYSRVPGSDISYIVNNTAVDCIDGAEQVCVVTDLLYKCFPDYAAFPGKPYLIANTDLQREVSQRLPHDRLLVGLSWRSSITTHSRNEHYLTVEELAPIFELEGIQFVNLQYDECQDELDWVENRYPGKMINLPDIDQFNDFESVAALMKSVDLMIAPATTVVELAGALGCPTWMLSNSSELHWRKIDEAGTDVWHNSITHVEGRVLGDKASLVEELISRLVDFSAQTKNKTLSA